VNQELVVGWAGFGSPRDEDCDPAVVAELYGLYLLPEYWGLGFGQQL
jgi:GNAT superfamily N-acetyltransferase